MKTIWWLPPSKKIRRWNAATAESETIWTTKGAYYEEDDFIYQNPNDVIPIKNNEYNVFIRLPYSALPYTWIAVRKRDIFECERDGTSIKCLE